ncbi:hypothetical protein GCM10009554_27640 [Kribbella koreensis]|uniref:Uncharacterized protein n=1 Tax=Kribbella koreensis TaxID=57909 RepID=A0ABN1Q7U0_9ACTN
MPAEDREALQQFVRQLDEFLRLAIGPDGLLPSEQSQELLAAYDELADRDAFAELREVVGDAAYDERLFVCGLTGANLRVKLAGWARSLARLFNAVGPGPRRYLSAFKWANTILGSILAATGVGEAVKELKEAAENTYEDLTD